MSVYGAQIVHFIFEKQTTKFAINKFGRPFNCPVLAEDASKLMRIDRCNATSKIFA